MQYLSFGGNRIQQDFLRNERVLRPFALQRRPRTANTGTASRTTGSSRRSKPAGRWGINTVETSANERITAILGSLNAKTGDRPALRRQHENRSYLDHEEPPSKTRLPNPEQDGDLRHPFPIHRQRFSRTARIQGAGRDARGKSTKRVSSPASRPTP